MVVRLTVIESDKKLEKNILEIFDTDDYSLTFLKLSTAAPADIDVDSTDAIFLCEEFTEQLCDDVIKPIKTKKHIPILVITSAKDKDEMITAVEYGVDDFVFHPIHEAEIEPRLHMLLAKARLKQQDEKPAPSSIKKINGWRYELGTGCLFDLDGKYVPLTGRESAILALLIENPQKTLSRDFIMRKVAGRKSSSIDRSLDVSIGKIRHKLDDDPLEPRFIKTIRGGGYLFIADITS